MDTGKLNNLMVDYFKILVIDKIMKNTERIFNKGKKDKYHLSEEFIELIIEKY